MSSTQNYNRDPAMEVMSFAIHQLTKSWTPEQNMEFSKKCFDQVVQDKYHNFAEYPKMNITVTRQ